jgi:DDE family transposase
MIQPHYAFKLEEEVGLQVTALAGLPLLYEVFHRMKLPEIIQKHAQVKQDGWSDTELIETIVALVSAGGEHMDDVGLLQSDPALLSLLGKESEPSDRKNRRKELPAAKAIARYLKGFHRDFQRPEGVLAFVPEETQELQGLGCVLQTVARKMIHKAGLKAVTIENDATPVFSHKQEAQGTYKGGIGYMPVTATVAELGITIADEFRDGNVPPAFEVTRFFKEGLKAIPTGVRVKARLDGAYYDQELIAFLQDPNKAWGVIEFTITAKKTASLLEWIEALPGSAWKPLMRLTSSGPEPTGREWAELSWTSAGGSQAEMKARRLRYLVTRKMEAQWELFQKEFKDEVKAKDRYEVICTNQDWAGDRLIRAVVKKFVSEPVIIFTHPVQNAC